jgi:hypothetical protein
MIGKYQGDKLVWTNFGEHLLDQILEGADNLIEHFDRDGLKLDWGEQVIREEIGPLKYNDQGRALQRCLENNPEGKWLQDYIERTFAQYWGKDGNGKGSIWHCYKNKAKNPGRLRTELECFKSAMGMAKNYAKENPGIFRENAY